MTVLKFIIAVMPLLMKLFVIFKKGEPDAFDVYKEFMQAQIDSKDGDKHVTRHMDDVINRLQTLT